jgi:hypothetical protein
MTNNQQPEEKRLSVSLGFLQAAALVLTIVLLIVTSDATASRVELIRCQVIASVVLLAVSICFGGAYCTLIIQVSREKAKPFSVVQFWSFIAGLCLTAWAIVKVL